MSSYRRYRDTPGPTPSTVLYLVDRRTMSVLIFSNAIHAKIFLVVSICYIHQKMPKTTMIWYVKKISTLLFYFWCYTKLEKLAKIAKFRDIFERLKYAISWHKNDFFCNPIYVPLPKHKYFTPCNPKLTVSKND